MVGYYNQKCGQNTNKCNSYRHFALFTFYGLGGVREKFCPCVFPSAFYTGKTDLDTVAPGKNF